MNLQTPSFSISIPNSGQVPREFLHHELDTKRMERVESIYLQTTYHSSIQKRKTTKTPSAIVINNAHLTERSFSQNIYKTLREYLEEKQLSELKKKEE